MREYLRKRLECWFIFMAAKILMNRNLQRSTVTSRRDNNEMWYMGERLGLIVKRIKNDYAES